MELEEKDDLIEKLQVKYQQVLTEQLNNKRSTVMIRSLEAQLKASEEVIVQLKKQIKQHEAKADQLLPRRQDTKKPISSRINLKDNESSIVGLSHADFHSDNEDDGQFCESELQPLENKAEEIFQRSRSTRSDLRRSLLVKPTTSRDVPTVQEECSFQKSYSLRQRNERRRSFQPRLWNFSCRHLYCFCYFQMQILIYVCNGYYGENAQV